MRISEEKLKRIKEEILSLLFYSSPNALFTAYIARELARDEEFVKKMLEEMQLKGLVVRVSKNSKGKDYLKRARWRLSDRAYSAYKTAGQTKLH